MTRKFSWVISLTGIMIIAAIGVIFWGYNVLRHHGPFRTDSIVIIPKGSGTEQITSLLAQNGLVEHPTVFNLAVRTFGADKVLQAGEYSIPKGSSPLDILSILQSGRTIVRSFTVAEGLNNSEILGRVMKTKELKKHNKKEKTIMGQSGRQSSGCRGGVFAEPNETSVVRPPGRGSAGRQQSLACERV